MLPRRTVHQQAELQSTRDLENLAAFAVAPCMMRVAMGWGEGVIRYLAFLSR